MVGVAEGDGKTVGEGEGLVVGVGAGLAFSSNLLAFHTNCFPLLTQVNFNPL